MPPTSAVVCLPNPISIAAAERHAALDELSACRMPTRISTTGPIRPAIARTSSITRLDTRTGRSTTVVYRVPIDSIKSGRPMKVEYGTVVESMVTDTRGEKLVRVQRSGHVKALSRTAAKRGPRPIMSVRNGQLESIIVQTDEGREQIVVQEVQDRRFEPGDRVRVESGARISVYHAL